MPEGCLLRCAVALTVCGESGQRSGKYRSNKQPRVRYDGIPFRPVCRKFPPDRKARLISHGIEKLLPIPLPIGVRLRVTARAHHLALLLLLLLLAALFALPQGGSSFRDSFSSSYKLLDGGRNRFLMWYSFWRMGWKMVQVDFVKDGRK